MADQQKLLQALRNASRAADQGDQRAAQDARRLAQMLKQSQQAQPSWAGGGQSEPQKRGGLDQFARGFGSGLADWVGIPVGAAQEAWGIAKDPTGFVERVKDDPSQLWANAGSGRDTIREVAGPLGLTNMPGEDPNDSLLGAAGQATSTFGLGGALTAGKLAGSAISRGLTTGAPQIPGATALRRIIDDMGTVAARRPAVAGATEMTGAAGAAVGREIAEEDYGEGSWQAGVSELVGGVLGSATPAGVLESAPRAVSRTMDFFPMSRMVKRSVSRFMGLPESEATNTAVRQRIQEVTDLKGRLESSDPEVSAAAQARLEELQRGLRGQDADVIPEMLTPAQRTGDEGIMSLAARARADNPQLMAHWREQHSANLEALRQQLRGVNADEITQLSDAAEQNLDDMIMTASANAQRKISSVRRDGALSPAEASELVQQELQSAYRGARSVEREFWSQVPDDMVMPANQARDRYTELMRDLGEISAQDMPQVARQYMDPNSPQTWLRPPEGDAEDVIPLKRLQELRSALLDEAANASAGANPNRNRARLARQLADGLRQDLEAVDPRESPGTAAFVAARNYSRKLNDRFTRGTVGDVLKLSARRETSMPAEEVLDRTVGRGGIKAMRTTRDFVRALESPSEGVKGAFDDYLNEQFMRASFREGPDGQMTLNQGGAERFMAKYKDMLDRMPSVREKYQNAIAAGRLDSAAMRVNDGVAKVLSSGNPAAEVRKIRQLAPDTPDGRAVWQGFRRNLLADIEAGATRARDGESQFSGQAIITRLDTDAKYRRAMEEAFSPEELRNIRRIANTAARLELDAATPAAARLTDAQPSMLNRIFAQITGARAGSAVDKALSGGSAGTNLQSAQLGSSIMRKLGERGIRDPQADLILSALNNKELMEALLIPPRTRPMEDRFASVVNAWATHVMDRHDAEQAGVEFDAELDDYIGDAVSGLGGKPTADDKRRMRELERETRLRPVNLPDQGRSFDIPIRGPQGQTTVGEALRGLPGLPQPDRDALRRHRQQ